MRASTSLIFVISLVVLICAYASCVVKAQEEPESESDSAWLFDSLFGGSNSGSSSSSSGSYNPPSTSSGSCKKTTTAVNMRSGPGTGYSIVRTLPSGTQVTVSSESLGWSRTSNGYISSTYLTSCSTSSGYTSGSTGGSSWGSTGSTTGSGSTRPGSSFSSSGSCALFRYSNSAFTGSQVVASPSFRPYLDQLASYANSCGVKIYVTSSYRSNSNVSGAIVTPATRSNHMVGMAIDMNLHASGYSSCTSSCLRNINSAAEPYRCFINKVKMSSMRWGQSFNDPVHIDYPLNQSPSSWDSQYRATQESYNRRCY